MKIKKIEETFGEKAAHFVSSVVGSWLFVASLMAGFAAWMMQNLIWKTPLDPWPFILLGLIISIMTIIQEPIMLMSQNLGSKRSDAIARANLELLESVEAEVKALRTELKILQSELPK